MDIREIYSKIVERMIQGMMFHDQMANYYDFLGLQGYKRCHEYHFMKETCAYRGVSRYFINHHNMLIPEPEFSNESVIPDSWYSHVRGDVDTGTKKNAIKTGLTKWMEWETDTKRLYEDLYKEALDAGDVASAFKIGCLVKDVDKELKSVERYYLNKEATNYDIGGIIAEQKKKHKKYQCKMEKELRVTIC